VYVRILYVSNDAQCRATALNVLVVAISVCCVIGHGVSRILQAHKAGTLLGKEVHSRQFLGVSFKLSCLPAPTPLPLSFHLYGLPLPVCVKLLHGCVGMCRRSLVCLQFVFARVHLVCPTRRLPNGVYVCRWYVLCVSFLHGNPIVFVRVCELCA
jgi:hypothetical protein